MMRKTNTPVNENVEGTRPVRFSELLENPPPDDVLWELFPRPEYATIISTTSRYAANLGPIEPRPIMDFTS